MTINKYLAVINSTSVELETKTYILSPPREKDINSTGKGYKLPITDPLKRGIAQKRRLYMKICRACGVRNAPTAKKCRKCRSPNLRWKKREKSR